MGRRQDGHESFRDDKVSLSPAQSHSFLLIFSRDALFLILQGQQKTCRFFFFL